MRRIVVVVSLLATVGAAYHYEQVWMPMRDSIELKTDVYFPDSSGPPWPAVLWRTPYGGLWPWWATALLTDSMGYVVALQSMRGWQGSQGEKTLFTADGWANHRDGYDAIEWIAAQSWSDGKVCMMGQSAMGIAQYLAAGASPPHLVCCCPDIAYLDPYLHGAWMGGEFRKGYLETWCISQGTPYFVDTVCNHPNYDSMYALMNLAERWDSAAYPMFHIGGWYDMHLEGPLSAYPALQAKLHNQKLLVGPWGHTMTPSRQQGGLTYPANAALPERERYKLMWRWYDHWVNDSANGITEPKVCFYLMGDCDTEDTTECNYWYEADTWPLPGLVHHDYYLREDGLLDTLPPSGGSVDTFLYDPADPCTSYGGKEWWGLTHGYGPQDQRPIEGRSDVLVFETSELERGLAVVGKIRCVLYAASDRFDTDWSVRVTDVYPDGRSMLITDGILMARHRHGFDREDSLVPGVPDTFDIDVGSTANVFAPGHRLRVIISSSNYPRFEKNPNTGAPFERNPTNCLVATQQVYRSAALPSHLVLPVHPGLSGMAEGATQDAVRRAAGPTVVRGTLSLPSGVDVVLLDVNGRRVMDLPGALASGASGAVRHHDIRHLAPGVYFVHSASCMMREASGVTKVIVTK